VLAPAPAQTLASSPEAPDGASEEPAPSALSRIARCLKATGRRSDAVGRLGLGAFAVVALDTDGNQARRLADRLCGAILGDPSAPAIPELRLQAGVHGVSDFHAASIDAVELMFRATTALRQARTDPAGGWLRNFEDTATAPPLA
jgi:GGDEF domain-containing protein